MSAADECNNFSIAGDAVDSCHNDSDPVSFRPLNHRNFVSYDCVHTDSGNAINQQRL